MKQEHYPGETNPHGMSPDEWKNFINEHSETVDWTDERLKKITRLRLLSDPGFPMWDVSYCMGELHDGTKVWVHLPFDQLPRKNTTAAIIKYAKRDGIYAKGLGILSGISTVI